MPSDALNKGGPDAVPAAAAVRAFRQLWVAFFCLFVSPPLLKKNFMLQIVSIYPNPRAERSPSIPERPELKYLCTGHAPIKIAIPFCISLFSVSILGPFP